MKAGVMLSLLGLVLPAMVAFADHHDYMVERIQHPDLIPGFIASVVQDHEGFIWLATSDGLYRHDEKRFIAYKSEVRNSHSLPNNNVRNVFVDSQGGLWVLSALQLLQLQPVLSYDEQLELSKTMEEFLNKQLAMVSRILDHQALESGVIDVRFSPVTLNHFCEKLVSTYQKKAAPKRISIQMGEATHFCADG